MRLPETIYQLRTQKGMSQGDLAEALEVSRQSVSKWETGGATPDLDKLVKMSTLFGVTLDELVTGEKAQPESQPEPQVVYVERPREGYPKRKIVALVLFGLGFLIVLLCTVLGGMLAGILYSLPFWVCGVICMTCRKRCGLWCAWVVFFLLDVFLRIASGVSWGGIYYLVRQMVRGVNLRWIISLVLTVIIAGLLIWTVWSFREKTLKPTRKMLVKLMGLALLLVICYGLPWIVSIMTADYVGNITSGSTLYRITRVTQVLGTVSSWGKIWALCTAMIDLCAIHRFQKKHQA